MTALWQCLQARWSEQLSKMACGVCCLFLVSTTVADSIIQDPEFLQGYEVMSIRTNSYTNKPLVETQHARFSEVDSTPLWRLNQWGTYQSIAHTVAQRESDHTTRWTTFSMLDQAVINKSVALQRSGDQPGSFILELNGLDEFSVSKQRSVDEQAPLYLKSQRSTWPHLLFSQSLKSQRLADYAELRLRLASKLLFHQPNYQPGYSKDKHAARFVISLGVTNTLSGNLYWLMLPIFDDRYVHSSFGCVKCDPPRGCYTPTLLDDPGHWQCPFDANFDDLHERRNATRKMLFRVDSRLFLDRPLEVGEWSTVDVDLLPFIKAGIEAAREQPRLRHFSQSLYHYHLTFFSIGWEITGLNHVAMQVQDLALEGIEQ